MNQLKKRNGRFVAVIQGQVGKCGQSKVMLYAAFLLTQITLAALRWVISPGALLLFFYNLFPIISWVGATYSGYLGKMVMLYRIIIPAEIGIYTYLQTDSRLIDHFSR